MFAKLLKYEWRANAATLGILSAAAVGASVLGAVALNILLTYDGKISDIAAFGLGTLLFFVVLALIGYAVATEIILLSRYYKNKFTDEGYLTFTLPVNSHQIFLSSLVNMLIWTVIVGVVLALCVGIIVFFGTIGNSLLPENFSALWSDFFTEVLAPEFSEGYWVMYGLQFVVSIVYSIVIALTCLTVGSVIAKKHKILASFGIYYGISFVSSILSSILSIAVTVPEVLYETYDYAEWMTRTIALEIAAQVVLMVIAYLVSTYLMKRELNLS